MSVNNILKIFIGEKEVIQNGTIVTVEKNVNVQFVGGFEFGFIFLDDVDDKSARVKMVGSRDSKSVTLEVINFNNSFGQMTIDPMPFASNTETKLTMFISFAVYKVGVGAVLHYTFLEGKESNS